MLSKHPLDIQPGRRLAREEVPEALRLAIIAELDAINLYLQLARAIDDERVKKVFEDVAREEKTHVGEFLAVLKHLDPEQAEELVKGAEEVKEIAGLTQPTQGPSAPPKGPLSTGSTGFEVEVSKRVKELYESARVLVKKLPVVNLGRGVDTTTFERVDEKVERIALPLCELSSRFKVSQRAVDYATKAREAVEIPEAVKAILGLALEEEKIVVESLIRDGKVRLPVSKWDEPGISVLDVAKAVAELSRLGFRRPYLLVVSIPRYTKLLSVSEKTGVTDLERVKAIVDDVVASPVVPEDKALLISATPEVLDVVYGGNAEVDYIGPEDGYHAFRAWSSVALRLKLPSGVVVMEETTGK